MANLFGVLHGIEIDESTQFLTGAGVPNSADTDAAPIGSLYLNSQSDANLLNVWYKHTAGTGTNKWSLLASKDYVDANSNAVSSWREPAVVIDNSSTTLPTSTPASTIDVDGVTISDGQRVLFSALTGGNGKNIYIYDQASGAFVEDSNNESTGDAVYIQDGTFAGYTYIFDGSNWQLLDKNAIDEINFINTFIGKDAFGSESPTYSSTTQVTQNGSLEAVIGELDAEIGNDPASNTIITDTDTVNQNIESIANYVEGQSLATSNTNITTQTTVDSVVALAAKWLVRVIVNGDSTRVRAYEVFATHDETTNVDQTEYAVLALGTAPSGLNITVTVSGGDTLNLTLTSTDAVDVKTIRQGYIS